MAKNANRLIFENFKSLKKSNDIREFKIITFNNKTEKAKKKAGNRKEKILNRELFLIGLSRILSEKNA